MSNYWADRIARAQTAITSKNIKAVEKQLAKYYGTAAKNAIREFEDVYNSILLAAEEGREPTPADLYKLDKYWQAQGALRQELQKLGEKQISLLTKHFEINFFEIYYSFALEGSEAFSTLNTAGAMQMINQIWVADGKTYSQRVWDNIGRLTETLNSELINCVVTGKKPTELKRILQERFNVSYRRADTLVRTEMVHIQTRAAEERYKDYGIEQVEVLVDIDERTCEECAALDGQVFSIHDAPILPLHPNERCCLVPVI
jgi:SPP1 gp7 family putative phage head morphogenesis protein